MFVEHTTCDTAVRVLGVLACRFLSVLTAGSHKCTKPRVAQTRVSKCSLWHNQGCHKVPVTHAAMSLNVLKTLATVSGAGWNMVRWADLRKSNTGRGHKILTLAIGSCTCLQGAAAHLIPSAASWHHAWILTHTCKHAHCKLQHRQQSEYAPARCCHAAQVPTLLVVSFDGSILAACCA